MGYISIADRTTLVSTWSQTIAEVCFHMIADDRRTFCDLRSAIVCDHMETSLKQFSWLLVVHAKLLTSYRKSSVHGDLFMLSHLEVCVERGFAWALEPRLQNFSLMRLLALFVVIKHSVMMNPITWQTDISSLKEHHRKIERRYSFWPNRRFFMVFHEMRHLMQALAEKLQKTPKHDSLWVFIAKIVFVSELHTSYEFSVKENGLSSS